MPRPRWARSCARSPTVTPSNSTPCTAGSWPQLAAHTPLLPGAGEKAFIDVDSTHKRVYGRTKQGAEYGRFKGIRTLHPLLATICTPTSRPVIATVRLRRGKAADSRGAPKLRQRGPGHRRRGRLHRDLRILRADSQFYNAGVIAACRRAGAHFSVTMRHEPLHQTGRPRPSPNAAWQQISYPTARARPRHRRAHLGRRGRRDTRLHRVREPEEERAGHRPPHRAPGP